MLCKNEAESISEEEFALLMTQFSSLAVESGFAVAVSGGADSLALAFMLQRWWKKTPVKAFIVDHALRMEAAEEAVLTAERLQKMGLDPEIWRLAPLPSGSVQEQARHARFALLEHQCSMAGLPFLFVAHHRDDQDETLWMRHERGSGVRGLEGMARASVRGRIAILRPLLSVPPQRLRATLWQACLEWCEDPSNQNRRFRRVQIRQDLTQAQRMAMRELQQTARKDVKQSEVVWARFLALFIQWQAEGWIRIAPEFFHFSGMEAQEAVACLSAILRLVGGQDYPANRLKVAALYKRRSGSLSAAILCRRQGFYSVMRERRHRGPDVAARTGQIWDGRWRYIGPDLSETHVVAALGKAAASRYRRGRDVPLAVLEMLPALWHKSDRNSRGGNELPSPYAVPEEARGLCITLKRAAFIWDAGTMITGEKLLR